MANNFFSSGIPSNNCVMDNTSVEMETTQVEETLSPGSPKCNGYQSKRKAEALTMKSIHEDIGKVCCGKDCNSQLSATEVMDYRKQYHGCRQQNERQVKLMQMMRSSRCTSDKQQNYHIFNGMRICKQSWYECAVKVSRATYYRTKSIVDQGIFQLPQVGRQNTAQRKGKVAVGFMQLFISLHGDYTPDSGKIVLSPGINIKDAFCQYKKTYNNDEQIHISRFYELWKKEFPNVIQPKYTSFTKCSVCLLAKHLLMQNLPPEQEALARKDRDEHLKRQEFERKAYYNRRASAIMHPAEKLSVIADGMDQAKTNLPHLTGWQKPKSWDATNLLQTHIVGVMLHGLRTYYFIDILQWPHDANLTMNCLLYAISLEFKNETLPSTMYLQLDNCGRENKNKYFLGMMALLIKWGYFDEISMNFLMVGHTHEDIDARFSRVAQALKQNCAKTFPQLCEVMNGSLEDRNEIRSLFLPAVYNIRDWLSPFLNSIHDHSYPHAYRFYKDTSGHVVMQYKAWSSDLSWLPNPRERLEIFKVDQDGKQMVPPNTPGLVEPDYNRKQDLTCILQNINKNKLFLSQSELEWWEMFVAEPSQCCSLTIPWHLATLKTQELATRIEPANIQPAVNDASPLAQAMQKERKVPQVQTGLQKRKPAVQPAQCNPSPSIKVGDMVGFKDENNKLGVGQVCEIKADSLNLILYQGMINSTWEIVKVGGKNVTVCTRKEDVIQNSSFSLKDRKMPNHIKNLIKQFL